MESKGIDAAEFRDAQHQQWDKASVGWKKHSDFIDSASSHISDRLVELAGIAAGSYDAAVSRWGIIFDPDGEGAAARVRSFLAPGGRMAISSWGPPDKVPFLGVPVMTVMQRLNVPPPPPGTPGPLSRPTPEAIGGLLEGGGFSDVEVEEAEVTFTWSSAEEFTAFVREIAPPVTAMMASHPQEVQDETWAAITAAAAEHAAGDGTIEQKNLVLLASGSA